MFFFPIADTTGKETFSKCSCFLPLWFRFWIQVWGLGPIFLKFWVKFPNSYKFWKSTVVLHAWTQNLVHKTYPHAFAEICQGDKSIGPGVATQLLVPCFALFSPETDLDLNIRMILSLRSITVLKPVTLWLLIRQFFFFMDRATAAKGFPVVQAFHWDLSQLCSTFHTQNFPLLQG